LAAVERALSVVALSVRGNKLTTQLFLMVLALALCCICQKAIAQELKACAEPESSPLIVNVRDKGAKGDGKSDDTTAIQAAIDEAVPVDVLSAALFTRFRSRQEHTFAEKVLSAMRQKFGGHVEPTASEKKTA